MRHYYLDEQNGLIVRIQENNVWPHQQFPLPALVVKLIFLASSNPLNFAYFIDVNVALCLYFRGFYGTRFG